MSNTKCVICTTKVQTNQVLNKNKSDQVGHRLLNLELSVIFFLKDLLPKDLITQIGENESSRTKGGSCGQVSKVLEGWLQSKGSPSSWISFCGACSNLVEDAKELKIKIDRLQAQFEGVRERVLTTIQDTFLQSDKSEELTGNIKFSQSGIYNDLRAAVITTKDKDTYKKNSPADKDGQNQLESVKVENLEFDHDADIDIKVESESDRDEEIIQNFDLLSDIIISPSKSNDTNTGTIVEHPEEDSTENLDFLADVLVSPSTLDDTVNGVSKRKTRAVISSSHSTKQNKKTKFSKKSLNDINSKQNDVDQVNHDHVNFEDLDKKIICTKLGRRTAKPVDYSKFLGEVDSDEDEEGKSSRMHEKDGREFVSVQDSEPESDGFSAKYSSSECSESSSNEDDVSSASDNDLMSKEDDENSDKQPASKRKKRVRVRVRINCGEPDCTRTFSSQEQKDKHFHLKHEPGWEERERLKKNGKKYPCESCGEIFLRKKLLKIHWQDIHKIFPKKRGVYNGKNHVCEFCGEKYRNNNELQIHRRNHTGEKPFACDSCAESFISVLFRERHIEKHHWAIPPIKCEFCDRGFFRQHRLQLHLVTHTKQKKYMCELCGKSYSHPTMLKYHQTTHEELNLEAFKCEQCDKIFRSPTNLKNHVKAIHLKAYPLHCEVCGIGFLSLSHKRKHMMSHTGEKPFSCDICGAKFRFSERLVIHTRSHTGERPFICKICGKSFACSSKLRRHEKIHGGVRDGPANILPYPCDQCGRTFAESRYLAAHKKYCRACNNGGGE